MFISIYLVCYTKRLIKYIFDPTHIHNGRLHVGNKSRFTEILEGFDLFFDFFACLKLGINHTIILERSELRERSDRQCYHSVRNSGPRHYV